MKKSLDTKLIAYSATAATILSASLGSSAIQPQTSINQTLSSDGQYYDITFGGNAKFRLGLKKSVNTHKSYFPLGSTFVTTSPSGTYPFNGFFTPTSSTWTYFSTNNSLGIAPAAGSAQAKFAVSTTGYVGALNTGATISASKQSFVGTVNPGNVGAYSNTSFYAVDTRGNFPGQTKFLGLQFQLIGQTHYGWCKLQVDGNVGSATVISAAYEDIPNLGILAGETDTSLPVELSSFMAESVNNGVKLTWRTESEKENLGFVIEKSEAGSLEWHEIASYKTHDGLKGHNTSTTTQNYEFMDKDVIVGKTYRYRLGQANIDGSVKTKKTIAITVNATPTNFVLKQNYPNPFNPTTTIDFSLKETETVRLSVFNMKGQMIETLIDGELNAGAHSTEWNAAQVPAGTYFYQLQAGSFKEIKKAVLIK